MTDFTGIHDERITSHEPNEPFDSKLEILLHNIKFNNSLPREEHKKMLKGLDVSGVDWSPRGNGEYELKFKGYDFTGTNFENAKFNGVEFHAVHFKNANLKNVDFTGCVFNSCYFQGASLMGVTLYQSEFKYCKFDKKTDFTDAKILFTHFHKTHLNEVDFSKVESMSVFNLNTDDVDKVKGKKEGQKFISAEKAKEIEVLSKRTKDSPEEPAKKISPELKEETIVEESVEETPEPPKKKSRPHYERISGKYIVFMKDGENISDWKKKLAPKMREYKNARFSQQAKIREEINELIGTIYVINGYENILYNFENFLEHDNDTKIRPIPIGHVGTEGETEKEEAVYTHFTSGDQFSLTTNGVSSLGWTAKEGYIPIINKSKENQANQEVKRREEAKEKQRRKEEKEKYGYSSSDDSSSEEEITVKEITTSDGHKYYVDEDNNLYDPESHDVVGKYDPESKKKIGGKTRKNCKKGGGKTRKNKK